MAGQPITIGSQRAITVRPNELQAEELIAPIQAEAGEHKDDDEDKKEVVETDVPTSAKGQARWEQLHEQVEDLNLRVARHFEDANANNQWKPPMVRSPQHPTKEEWLQHQLTHTPYAPWCKHCIAARRMRAHHQCAKFRTKIVPDTNGSEIGPVKISMVYMYMHERIGVYTETKRNPLYLVVVEHRYGRVWAYKTPNKGPNDEACWVPEKLTQDWDNCGFKDIRIQLKIDQEPAMINLQGTIQNLRPAEVIPINSPIGESESNGRAENVIRRGQEKVRALRHQLETNIKMKILDSTPIMAWLVRWAAELLSKYTCGDDGKSPHERLHGEKCTTPLVPFRESVLYLPMKTMRRDKGDAAKKQGIWLGIIARTQEVLIGIEDGVVKCRTMTRLPDEEK